MEGASALDPSVLRGHTMINLDSEGEGVLLAGCAGGCHMQVNLPLKRETVTGIFATLKVDGLKEDIPAPRSIKAVPMPISCLVRCSQRWQRRFRIIW